VFARDRAPAVAALASPRRTSRRFVLQKARRHPTRELRRIAGARFQALFHSPLPGCFSPVPRGTLRYRSCRVFSLGTWSSQLPTEFHVLRGTHESPASQHPYADGALTRCGRPFQWRLARMLVSKLARGSCRAARGTVLPHTRIGRQTTQRTWFGLRAFRSPLLRAFSLFHRVLRCFSSPGSLRTPYVFRGGWRGTTPAGLLHSGTLGLLRGSRSPRCFAASPRPSSALQAKASTTRHVDSRRGVSRQPD
jgi:hypothetical protein